MDSILITGGAGFVGSTLGLALKADFPARRIIAFDNLKRRGSELNLPRLKAAGIEFIHGDVRSRDDLDGIGHVDLIIECSAEPSVLAGYATSPLYLLDTNLVGAVNCFELARRYRADVIFLSTSRVYPIRPLSGLPLVEDETRFDLPDGKSGHGWSKLGIAESFDLNGARSMYGATKLTAELLLAEYAEMYGIRAVVNRCGVLTGPWQMGKVDQGFVVLWIARHLFGGALTYLGYGGQGKQVRDILHVHDLYRLVRLQAEDMNRYAGGAYNVGGGHDRSISLRELTELTRDITGREIPVGSDPRTRAGDVPYYVSDCTKLITLSGWRPTYSVRDIVQEIKGWIHEHREQLKPILA